PFQINKKLLAKEEGNKRNDHHRFFFSYFVSKKKKAIETEMSSKLEVAGRRALAMQIQQNIVNIIFYQIVLKKLKFAQIKNQKFYTKNKTSKHIKIQTEFFRNIQLKKVFQKRFNVIFGSNLNFPFQLECSLFLHVKSAKKCKLKINNLIQFNYLS
ncbi:hypothetical protein RFI_32944, partial [Reticulomyxa filosa]